MFFGNEYRPVLLGDLNERIWEGVRSATFEYDLYSDVI